MAETQFAFAQKIESSPIADDVETIDKPRRPPSEGDNSPAHCFNIRDVRASFLRCHR